MTPTARHDCREDRCDSDNRSPAEVEAEGFAAGLAGASYDDCPYGHRHPDLRFSPWQTGRWKARGEWCVTHGQPGSWCVSDMAALAWTERRIVIEPLEQP